VVCVDNFFTGTRANAAASLAHKRFELLRHDATSRSTSRLTKSIILRVRLRRFITSTIRCRPRKPASTVRQPKPESGPVANFEEAYIPLCRRATAAGRHERYRCEAGWRSCRRSLLGGARVRKLRPFAARRSPCRGEKLKHWSIIDGRSAKRQRAH
jgi:hypothetical protein